MKNLLFSLAALLIIGCSSKQTVIKGNLNSMGEWSNEVYLLAIEDYNLVFSSSKINIIVDTALVDDNGNFQFFLNNLPCTECLYRIHVVPKGGNPTTIIGGSDKENYALFELSKGITVNIKADANKVTKSFSINGSDNWSYEEIRKLREPIYDVRESFSNVQHLSATEMDSFKNEALIIVDANNQKILNFIAKSSSIYDKLIGLKLLYDGDMNIYNKLEDFEKVSSELLSNYQDHPYFKQLNETIYNDKYVLPVGTQAPSLNLPDTSGQTINYTHIGQNLLLIDFWASWCSPCRKENKEVVRPLYDSYKDNGFQVYSISMDDDKEKWVKAIEKDGMTWTNVSDLLGNRSPVYSKYKIESLPTTYLVESGPNGYSIVAKNLRGEKLKKYLSTYYK